MKRICSTCICIVQSTERSMKDLYCFRKLEELFVYVRNCMALKVRTKEYLREKWDLKDLNE